MSRLLRGVLVVAALLPPAAARAQAMPPARTIEDPLLREVRLLRLAIERQSSINARAQLLMARLGVQDQRVGRASAAVERAQADAASAAQRSAQLQRELARARRLAEEAPDPNDRAAAEQQAQDLRRQMAQHGHPSSEPELRLGEARQALNAERARFEEIEGALERLDRELERPAR